MTISAYVISVFVFAFWEGFETPRSDQNRERIPHLLMISLFWPIVLLAVFGSACRMFSVKKIAEDAADAR